MLLFLNTVYNIHSLLPESPRWLLAKGRYDKAYRIVFKQKSHYHLNKMTTIESFTVTDKKTVRLCVVR